MREHLHDSPLEDGKDGARAVVALFKMNSQDGGWSVNFVVGMASGCCLCADTISLWGLMAVLVHRGHGVAWSEVGEPRNCVHQENAFSLPHPSSLAQLCLPT